MFALPIAIPDELLAEFRRRSHISDAALSCGK